MNIENKTILVTGANRGIGRALVEEALRRGGSQGKGALVLGEYLVPSGLSRGANGTSSPSRWQAGRLCLRVARL
jgi:nucleoside-diphosphate-sugar epimerase